MLKKCTVGWFVQVLRMPIGSGCSDMWLQTFRRSFSFFYDHHFWSQNTNITFIAYAIRFFSSLSKRLMFSALFPLFLFFIFCHSQRSPQKSRKFSRFYLKKLCVSVNWIAFVQIFYCFDLIESVYDEHNISIFCFFQIK